MPRWLACVLIASACVDPPPLPPAAETTSAVTAACTLLEFGAPCDPGAGTDECDGICWVDEAGLPACRVLSVLGLPDDYLDGRLCGTATSADCANGGRVCNRGSCDDINGGGQPVADGTACRPFGGANRCAGTCAAGMCLGLSPGGCPFGRGSPDAEASCLFSTCGALMGTCIVEELDGVVCDDGVSCSTDTVCETGSCVAAGCVIDGVCYNHGDLNPANECEECDSFFNPTGWWPVGSGTACTDLTPVNCQLAECNGAGVCDQTAGNQANGTPCGDLVCNQCSFGTCANSPIGVPGPGCNAEPTECSRVDTCGAGGMCQANHVAEGLPCTDVLPADCRHAQCNGAGACDQAGEPLPDGTECAAVGGCQIGGQCMGGNCPAVMPAPDGTACNDLNACTDPDSCSNGACNGGERPCGDSDPCTMDSCDNATGCVHTPIPGCGGNPDAGPGSDGGPGNPDAPVVGVEFEATGSGCTCRAAGAPRGPGLAAGLLLVGVLLVLLRRRRVAPLALLLALASTRVAFAQGFDTEIFQPPTSATRYFSQDEASVLAPLHFATGAVLQYSQGVLVVRVRETGETVGDGIVSDRLAAHLSASLGVGKNIEAGLTLPVVLSQSGQTALPGMDELPSSAVGDLRLGAKMLLHAAPEWSLAAALALGLGLGGDEGFAGDEGVSFLPRVILGWKGDRLARALHGTINLGYRLRDESPMVVGLQADDEITAGLGVMYGIVPERLSLAAEAYAYVGLAGEGADTPAEALIGLHYRPPLDGLAVKVGVGRGLGEGYGTPSIRGLLALEYTPSRRPPPRPVVAAAPAPRPVAPPPPAPVAVVPEPDGDGDKVPDSLDGCPAEPEDADEYADQDGCPDLDDDGDGFPDVVDTCPREGETFNAVNDQDGCPDKGAILVTLTRERLELAGPLVFEGNGARVARGSHKALGTVATILLLHPEIKKVRIRGARAEVVRRHLTVVNGLDAARLEVAVEPAPGGVELLIVERE